jgi:hypothetical protein
MPLFRPRDEMSVRHLFSTSYAEEILRLSYVGPALNPAADIESSPDSIVLDRRKSPFRTLRCEFKFIPLGKEDFAHNGRFELAVVWSLPKGVEKGPLLDELLQQNGCSDLIVLEDFKAFRDLPPYAIESIAKLGNVAIVRELAIKTDIASVFGLCMVARLYPDNFNMRRMVDFLRRRFPQVQRMKPKGRTNIISKFLQMKPPLIMHMHGKEYYRWTNEFDSVMAAAELTQLITGNFGKDPPTADDLDAIRQG